MVQQQPAQTKVTTQMERPMGWAIQVKETVMGAKLKLGLITNYISS